MLGKQREREGLRSRCACSLLSNKGERVRCLPVGILHLNRHRLTDGYHLSRLPRDQHILRALITIEGLLLFLPVDQNRGADVVVEATDDELFTLDFDILNYREPGGRRWAVADVTRHSKIRCAVVIAVSVNIARNYDVAVRLNGGRL